MQHINGVPQLDGQHGSIGIFVKAHGNLKNAASYTFEGLCILWYFTILDQLQFVTNQLLDSLRKGLNNLPRISQPFDRA